MNQIINIALIGCGHIAPRWLKAIDKNPNVNLVAVADPNVESLQKLDEYGFSEVKTYNTIEKAYEKEKFDAVIIANPPQYHSRYLIWAIEHNLHVLSEKPLCTSIHQLKHILKAQEMADKKKLITGVNQQYRWNPRVEAIRNAVQNKQIGQIYLVNSLLNQIGYHFKRWWRQQELYISAFNWFVHVIDSMRYYLEKIPVNVTAKFIHPPHSKILGYSSTVINVEFEDGIFWNLVANQESTAGPTTSGHTKFTMYGTEGIIENTKNDPPFLYQKEENQKIELGENIDDIDNGHTYPPGWPDALEKFVYAIKNGTEYPTSIKDNFWTIIIIFAAIESFETAKTVNIDEFRIKHNLHKLLNF